MKQIIVAFLLITVSLKAQTQIIAHRGYWKTTPETAENSIQSLKNAQKLGLYGSEFDVRMTKDGILVVNHDEHHGKMEIADYAYSELNQVKLSNGEDFPKLENYLKQGKQDPSVKLIVEIKPAKTAVLEQEIVSKVLKEIEWQKITEQTEYISFSLNVCKEIKKQQPGAKVQYLNGDLAPAELKELGIDGLDYHYKILIQKHPEWIAEAKKLGLLTNSWTVNNSDIFKQLVEMGVDFVTTNEPENFQKIIKSEK